MSENRWMPDSLQPPLIDDTSVDPTESQTNPSTAPPAAPQSIRPPQIQQAPPIEAPSQSTLSNNPRPMTVSQPDVGYPTASALPVATSVHHKPSDYTQRNDHAVQQMVLTNFKIEFTCTTCGSLNQSFFPNQGNVTGAGYMPQPSVPNQNTVARHPGAASSNETEDGGHEVAEDGGYVVNALSARDIHNAWAAGGLGVPIGPTNT